MLEVLRCPDPETKRRHFAEIDASRHTWVVSDLQSKWQLQSELLDRQGVLAQCAVMRATELWKRFAFQLHPEVRLLTPELAQTLFWNWIQPMNLSWARSPQAVPVVINQIRMWINVLADPQYEVIMAEWFQENEDCYVRWGHWFELASTIWKRCQERNLVMVNWLPGLLLARDASQLQWTRTLTFDLGPRITRVEGQLIKELGRYFDVRLIYPEVPWAGLMQNTLRPYDDLVSRPFKGGGTWEPPRQRFLSFGRFSTQLAEVKDAVAKVRSWLDTGVPPEKIAIIAPDIEEYWPALHLYLREEGIPAAKPVTAKLGGFIEMAHWLSTLRTSLEKISSRDLEVHLFSQRESPPLSCEEFRVLFSRIYGASDLKRATNLFTGTWTPPADTPVVLADFLSWSLRQWKASAETTRLGVFLQHVGQEVPSELQLLPQQWLSYFEGLLARRELPLKEDPSGIWCVSLSSADWLPASHGVLLNLAEGALRHMETSPVSASEGQKIFDDTGFAIGTADRQELEFEALWLFQQSWEQLRVTFAGTDFTGRVLTPSRLWMWAGFVNGQLKHQAEGPGSTRWDEIQKHDFMGLARLRAFSPSQMEGLKLGLRRDGDLTVTTWKPAAREVRLSASSLERYWKCPFQFAAERRFRLSDEPVLDLDLDRRTRGSLLHALAEELTHEPLNWERTDEELSALVEACRARVGVRLGDERLWPAIRAQHVRLARQFLEFEKAWRARFPFTRTVGRELKFQCYWDEESGRATATPTRVVISGRLDRVDQDAEGRYAVIDYKASTTNLRNWNSWLENHEIQLAFYSYLLERGLAGIPAGPVAAANYFVIKAGDRRKGFHLREESSQLYSCDEKFRNFITARDKAELFRQLEEKLNATLSQILNGEMNPRPDGETHCQTCSWSALCRAPHLN
ncbi:MAG: PD-(D/E)XK nuclease family protein [Bdellovibrionales bacterium]